MPNQTKGLQSGPKPKKKASKQKKRVDRRTLSPRFKLVFTAVTRITIICLISYIGLGAVLLFVPQESPIIDGLLETLKSTFILGFGAIVGLLSGKAL